MKHIYKFFVTLLVISVTISCSKDDSPETTPIDTNGGEIFTSQVVTVNLPNVELAQNEYQGTLGGTPVRLIKSGDHALLFSVPAGQNGAGDLVIPALNVTVHYTTTPTVLEGTPDEVMTDFNINLAAFEATLDNSPEATDVQNTINSFNTYYSNADEATKAQIAETYQANKAAFDQILQPNAGRIIVAGTEIYITKHVTAVALLGVGVAALGSPVIGVAVVGVAAYKAYKANADAVEHVYSTIGATIGGWFGDNDRGVNLNGPTLQNDELEQISFTLRERKIIDSDTAKTDPLAVQYFNSIEQYNYYATEGNEVIDETNNDEGTNFSDIPSEELPDTAQPIETEVTQEMLSNIQFSINDPNLLLVTANVSQEGMLNIRVKIMGTPSTYPVESVLNYSYSDGFSSFSGSLPIEVTGNILVGTWVLESFEDGTPVGEYADNGWSEACPSIITNSYTIVNRTLTFAETTFTATGQQIYVNHNLTWDDSNCSITANEPDTQETYNDSDSGTYTFDGTTLSFILESITETANLTIINSNKIKIEGEVYNRQ
jgi:hypothetical protein